MKKTVVFICALSLLLVPGPLFAKKPQKTKSQGPSPSESAYEHASDNARFKRGDDWQGGQGKNLQDEIITEEEEQEKKAKGQEKKKSAKDKKAKQKSDQVDDETDLVDEAEDGTKKKQKGNKSKKGSKKSNK